MAKNKVSKGGPKLRGVIVLLVIIAALFFIIGGGEKSDPPPKSDLPQQSLIRFGTLLDWTVNDLVSPKVIVIKTKITSNLTNKMTIGQNFYNVQGVAKSGEYNDYDIRYWAVADMTNGSESKVISFDVPSYVMKQLADDRILPGDLEKYVNNFWVLPSLK